MNAGDPEQDIATIMDPRMSKTKTATPKASSRNRKPAKAFVPPLTVSHKELLTAGTDDRFREVIYVFVEVLGRLATCREAFGRSIGLTGSQFAVLVGVAYRQGEDGVTIKHLSQYIHLAPTHVTTEVSRLIKLGLLDKRAAMDDRRSVRVKLTAAGEDTVVSVNRFVKRVNDILFSGVTATDLANAEEIFTKLSQNSEFAIAELKVAERSSYKTHINSKPAPLRG
ncbi:MAG: hypothetical protein BGP06_04800 [Rhizobiales bacterium 65-9]|nr:MAG: hypothetical protein BGP06_04800 [Rhizobiales bacterium 65-9]